MKKTKHTVLTALTFTAALQMATTANVNAVTEDEIGAIGVQKPFNAAEQEIQDVYGPAPDYNDGPTTSQVIETTILQTTTQIITTYGPPAMTWRDDATTTTEPTTSWYEESTTTTQLMTQPAYGPPMYLYNAPHGDLNDDGVVDVFDLIQMKKWIIKGYNWGGQWEAMYADVNDDLELNVADLVAMQNYILGRIPDFTTPVKNTTTTTTTAPDEQTATTTVDWSIVVPLYGPPEVLSTYTYPYYTYPPETTMTTVTPDITMQLMYGPPVTRPWDDDIIKTTSTKETTKTTTKKPRKTTTTTSSIQTTTTTSLPEFDPIDTGVQLMYGPPRYFDTNDLLDNKE